MTQANNEFTEKQLNNWAAYKRVQESGRFNMFDPNARASTGISRDDWVFCIENYVQLQKAYAEKQQVSRRK